MIQGKRQLTTEVANEILKKFPGVKWDQIFTIEETDDN